MSNAFFKLRIIESFEKIRVVPFKFQLIDYEVIKKSCI